MGFLVSTRAQSGSLKQLTAGAARSKRQCKRNRKTPNSRNARINDSLDNRDIVNSRCLHNPNVPLANRTNPHEANAETSARRRRPAERMIPRVVASCAAPSPAGEGELGSSAADGRGGSGHGGHSGLGAGNGGNGSHLVLCFGRCEKQLTVARLDATS